MNFLRKKSKMQGTVQQWEYSLIMLGSTLLISGRLSLVRMYDLHQNVCPFSHVYVTLAKN